MSDEEPLDVPPVATRWIALRIASQVAAAGALLGGVEGMVVASRSRLWLDPAERIQLTFGAVVADATVAFLAGLVGGGIAQMARSWEPHAKRYQRGFSLGFGLVAAFYLVPMALELWRRGDPKNTAGVLAVCCSVTLFGYLTAGYAYRREMIGLMPRLGWRIPAFGLAVLLALLSGLIPQRERPPAIAAPPGAANVILITIDTLRADRLGVYGGPVSTPNVDRLGLEGAIFEGAITPLPETAPSHASMFTGRHPSETKVVQNGRTLASNELTVTEQLSLSGWRTGAFVSSFAVDSSVGLDQGFEVYDDDFAPALRGVSEFRTGWMALRLLLRFGDPADWPSLLERRGDATVARALTWLDTLRPEQPVFLWVHLFDPHSPYDVHEDTGEFTVDHREILAQEPGYSYSDTEITALRRQYDAEVKFMDAQVGVLIEGLRARGRLEDAVVLLVGDHGESLGEHEIYFTHHGLYDEVLRVPMLLWEARPGDWASGTRVTQQVSVQDVPNTLLDYAGVPRLTKTDSTPLQLRLDGSQVRSEPLLLLGRAETDWLYGVRAPSGVKYIQSTAGKEELYDLNTDPAELRNLAENPGAVDAVRNGRTNVERLKTTVERGGSTDRGTTDLLEALGYADPPAEPPPAPAPGPAPAPAP